MGMRCARSHAGARVQELSKKGLSRALKEVMEDAGRVFEHEMDPDMLRKVSESFVPP